MTLSQLACILRAIDRAMDGAVVSVSVEGIECDIGSIICEPGDGQGEPDRVRLLAIGYVDHLSAAPVPAPVPPPLGPPTGPWCPQCAGSGLQPSARRDAPGGYTECDHCYGSGYDLGGGHAPQG